MREFTIDAADREHWERILRAIGSTRGARVLDYVDRTMQMHRGGKIEIHNKYPLKTRDDLSMAYTPGVARVCMDIHEDRAKAFEYTIKKNMVAVVSDGSAVLGLGNIGPEAAMPVMEGKAMLFKEFADVDAFPICLDTQDADEIVKAVELIAPTFGGINLEDISAPRCFEIEDRLKESLDIPVFHDDQHGTAVVTMAALFNALKIVGKPIEELRVLVVGLGAAGVAVTKMMLASGVTHIVGCDRRGALSTEREDYVSGEMSGIKRWYAENTNPERLSGQPADVIEGMDLFIGLSGPGIIPAEALGKMNDDAIVFAMANPNPEVMPEDAAPYVRIMATGRSDYPNQINNVLCFPGHLPRRPRRGRPADHRGDEAGCGEGDRRGGHRRRPLRGLHHPQRLQPRSRAEGRAGGGRGGEARRPRPLQRGDRAPSPRWRSRRPREGPRHRSQRLHRASALRRPAGPGRRGGGADARPRAGARHQSAGSPGTPGSRPWNGRPPRPSRESTGSSTCSARRSTSAGPTTPSAGSWRAAAPAPTTWWGRSPRWSASRRCWSASRRSATTATAARRSSTSPPRRAAASTPRWCGSGRRRRGRSRAAACGWSIVRTGHVLDPSGGLLAQLLTPFKLGVGGPLAGGEQYVSWIHIDDEVGILLWALDDASGERRRQLDRA